MQGRGKGMKNGKQMMKKPQMKVGGHEKWRKEEGKGAQPAGACRQRLPRAPAQPDQPKVFITRFVFTGPM